MFNDWRDLFGFGSVVVGVASITFLVVALLAYGKTPGEITTILGVVTGPIVAVVSAYFGLSVASRAQSQALEAQKETTAQVLAAGEGAQSPSSPPAAA